MPIAVTSASRMRTQVRKCERKVKKIKKSCDAIWYKMYAMNVLAVDFSKSKSGKL